MIGPSYREMFKSLDRQTWLDFQNAWNTWNEYTKGKGDPDWTHPLAVAANLASDRFGHINHVFLMVSWASTIPNRTMLG